MKMAKKSNTAKTQYNQQRMRLKNLIKKYESQGLQVEYALPKIPKRITPASINKLKKITYKDVRSKSFGVDFETGEKISYNKYKKQLNHEVASVRESSIVISNFRADMSHYNQKAYEAITNWLDNLISTTGSTNTAKMIQSAADHGAIPTGEDMYNSSKLLRTLSEMLDFLDVDQFERDSIEKSMELDEVWGN